MGDAPAPRLANAAQNARTTPRSAVAATSFADTAARFDEIFCELLPRLYRRAVLLVGHDAAEDVVHDAYLKLSARPHGLVGHPEPYAYAFSALVSVGRDGRRRGRRQIVTDAVPADGYDAFEMASAGWQAHWLLAKLTTRQAAAVVLVDLDGYTLDQFYTGTGFSGTVFRLARCQTYALHAWNGYGSWYNDEWGTVAYIEDSAHRVITASDSYYGPRYDDQYDFRPAYYVVPC
ncbi:MAG: RNA polymerase sigma factor [Catenulispora sp.]